MAMRRSQSRRVDTPGGVVDALGETNLLVQNRLAILCSQKCSGDVVLKTYDFAGWSAAWASPS